ncbi:MAG: type I-F CRISPR-associated protein Csy3 [Methylococcaceae bacterium]|nr:type I-F CRISPR-associated protein Csy3 [Methylococcaceae bacterium]
MKKSKENTPSVLAFEKKLVPSDGFMYGSTWENRHKSVKPLKLIEKSVRGVISNRLKTTQDADEETKKANLQRVDNCALEAEQDTLKLNFTLKVLSGVEFPSACDNKLFNDSYLEVVKQYIQDEKFTELAKRYAINIANARFLWRNRVGVGKLEVQVKVVEDERACWTFDESDAIKINDFESNNQKINELAEKIAHTLSGDTEYLLLEITAFAQIGKAQDVYPSEEMVLDKSNSKEKKSKILYQVNNQAAMHSQKIGNALRTIDTWYPDYIENNQRAIAIETYGSVTNLGVAYRKDRKVNFYTLFDKFARAEPLDSKEDEHFVMAVLVRGGVFGESTK